MVTTRRAVTTSKAVSKPAVAVKASKKSRTEAPVARSGGGSWFEEVYSGAMSEEYKRYMREEWGMEKRGDVPLFEKLSLEGAQAGLSWATILAKREAYRAAFHGFDIKACAAMGDAEIDALCAASGSGADCIVKHRGKIASVANNARCILRLAEEAEQRGDAPPLVRTLTLTLTLTRTLTLTLTLTPTLTLTLTLTPSTARWTRCSGALWTARRS